MLCLFVACLVSSWEMREGDRVALVGGAIVEREQQFGYLELALHERFPSTRFTVRNLGWSGDTVWGEARAGFGKPADGYQKLVEQVKTVRPTVLVLGYGTSEAFAGPMGLERFEKQYQRLLKDVGENCRCVFLTIPEPLKGKPVEGRKEYNAVIRKLAGGVQGTVLDIGTVLVASDSRTMTDDGILPNDAGYRRLAQLVQQQLGTSKSANFSPTQRQQLRELILKKDELYFHQYRPQNDTYLFGFRKHEQGQNAKEMPQFTPIIEGLDQQISAMKGLK